MKSGRKGRIVLPVVFVFATVVLLIAGHSISGRSSAPAATGDSAAAAAAAASPKADQPAARGSGGQPIAYNHKLHTQDLQITCVTCHRQVETGEVAGRPSIRTCLECHETAVTDKAEEHKIQQFAAAGLEIPWVRLTNLPRHVFFSHRRHVTVARLACAECHGPMEMRTSPPGQPLKPIRMSLCIDCHQKRGASVDCNACHH